MRVDVQKYLVVGPAVAKKEFFLTMQKLGIVEFITHDQLPANLPLDIQQLIDALHILRQMVPVKQTGGADFHSAHALAAAALENYECFERFQEKKRLLEKELARIEPFGDFSVASIQQLEQQTGICFQFLCAKEADKTTPSTDSLIFISHHLGLNYYLSIAKHKQAFEGYVEIFIEKDLSELKEELAEINRELDMIEVELSALAYQKKMLRKGLIDALNRYHLDAALATSSEILDQKVFAVEGWIPNNKLALVQKTADRLQLLVEPIALDECDRRPTYLENKSVGRLGEDLVDIYDTPSTTDHDPSAWVFFSFAIFFSMIVADAGYGLLILALSSWLFWKVRKKEGLAKRVVKLSIWLSVGCIFWGIMVSSFFAIPISPNNAIRKVSLIHWAAEAKANYVIKTKNATYQEIINTYPILKDVTAPHLFLTTVKKQTDSGEQFAIYDKFLDNFLIELAIFIGVIHLMISFIRYLDRYWAAIGWICALIGGYLFFPSILKATSFIYYLFNVPQQGSSTVGLYLLYSGIGLALLLSLIQNKFKGLTEVMNVIQVFADVMSYLRIYALSLAGMIMGSTFDTIGVSMPFYIGWIVILAGHTINFTLAMMGGVIHGLRLNFIEWYHYSFEGGGRKFKPLSLLKLD